MLSEGYILRCNLEEIAFEMPACHPDITKPGKQPGYRVGLRVDGLPEIVEEIDSASMGMLWYHREGKKNAFPVVKVQHALLNVPADDALRTELKNLKKNQLKERILILRRVVETRQHQLPRKDEQGWNRLRKKAKEWQTIFNETKGAYAALPVMLSRFACCEATPADWLGNLSQLVVKSLERGQLRDVALAEKLLIGVLSAESLAKAEVPLALDVAESTFPVYVTDRKMGNFVSGRLLEMTGQQAISSGTCALTGKRQTLVIRRFPERNLGSLGETKLFAKNKDTPCEMRYGLNGPNAMPVGECVARRIADALSAITAAELKGTTWRMVANGKWEGRGRNKTEKKDLLLVYLDGQPIINAQVANTFGNDEAERINQFENDAKAVCDALKGLIRERPATRLHLIVVAKADKERKQVVLHLTPTTAALLEGAERWQRAVRENLPSVSLPLPPPQKGKEPVKGQPYAPYPDRVVRLLASEWIRGGSEEQKVEGPALGQVLDLLLRTARCKSATEGLLELFVRRTGPLLVAISGALRSSNKKAFEEYAKDAREMALQAVGLLGILLDSLGRTKEVYMNDTAFRLGRLLALADTVHREYCVHVRHDSIPSQLIGNALMSAAADNPESAIDRLRERMAIYQAWAVRSDGETYALAKWAVGRMGEICGTITRPLPKCADQTFRAELFLGYMSHEPKEL